MRIALFSRQTLTLATLVLVIACKAPEPFEPGVNRYRFKAAAYQTATAGVISTLVMVEDLESRRFFATSNFLVSTGNPGTGKGQFQSQDTILVATVNLSSDGKAIQWKAELFKATQLIASSSGSAPVTTGPTRPF